ncbi:MAG: hypothetical protein KF703_04770 [Actinobacteria bacterium]|nr:hypothetical protein [Actinomycetota bacterium]
MRIEVLDDPPAGAVDEWDHVVEASLDGQGDVKVSSWDDLGPFITVAAPTGSLRLRCHWSGLWPGSAGIRPHDAPTEHLLVQCWSAPPKPPVNLVTWHDWRMPELGLASKAGRLEIRGQEQVKARLEGAPSLRIVDANSQPMPGYDKATTSTCYRLIADPEDVDRWWVSGVVFDHPVWVYVAVAIDRSEASAWLERCSPSPYCRDQAGNLYVGKVGPAGPSVDLVSTVGLGGPARVQERYDALVERGFTFEIVPVDFDPLPDDFWP